MASDSCVTVDTKNGNTVQVQVSNRVLGKMFLESAAGDHEKEKETLQKNLSKEHPNEVADSFTYGCEK